MQKSALLIFSLLILFGCKKKDETPTPTPTVYDPYGIIGNKIYKASNPIQLIGVNGLHVFSAGSADLANWNLDIAREFVGNMKESPLNGSVIQDANGAYLHPLQNVVDSNRKGNRITIICPFYWDGTAPTEFTGKKPSATAWWNLYKIKLQEWATYFKNQPDVWIEIWNEPYRYDRADGYTDDLWYSEMNEMVNIIRATGNTNILLVPCAEQGQDESVLINRGTQFLQNKKNILFDVHAYEKWLTVPNANVGNRLQALQQKKLPIFFGEVAPRNDVIIMNTQPFLDSAYNRGLSVCAWLWKYDANDTDALLTATGQPNNNGNNNWGSTYKAIAAKIRKP
jgi:mannan endo-1,4-beta-mannosidase